MLDADKKYSACHSVTEGRDTTVGMRERERERGKMRGRLPLFEAGNELFIGGNSFRREDHFSSFQRCMLGEIKYMFEFEPSFRSIFFVSLRDYKHANVTKPPPSKTKPFLPFLLSLCLLNFERGGRESNSVCLGSAITERESDAV